MNISNNSGFIISTDRSKLELDMIHSFLTESYWAKGIPLNLVQKSIQNSNPYGLYHQDRQVGFARVISDLSTFAYLADVFVIVEYQSRGLGKWLVEEIFKDPAYAEVRRWSLITEDAHSLYQRFGFLPLANPERYMEFRGFSTYLSN